MDAALIADTVQSPAVVILSDLHRDGFTIKLTDDDALTIAPRSRLTPERMQTIAIYKDALKALLRGDDAGVIHRREVFERLLACTPAPRVPAFLFREDIVYTKGTCFSCGDALPHLTFGRCWRCSLAWRLTCRHPMPADLVTALDGAKEIT